MVIPRVEGLPEPDGRALLADLLAHTTSSRYLYTHRWTQGDLIVWDNLAVLHTASPCDSSHHPRLLVRAAVRQQARRAGTPDGGITAERPASGSNRH